jgi:hypothetical protein
MYVWINPGNREVSKMATALTFTFMHVFVASIEAWCSMKSIWIHLPAICNEKNQDKKLKK